MNTLLATDTAKILEFVESLEVVIIGFIGLISVAFISIVGFSIWYLVADSRNNDESKEKAIKTGILFIPFLVTGAILGTLFSSLSSGGVEPIPVAFSSIMAGAAAFIFVFTTVHNKHVDVAIYKNEIGNKNSKVAAFLAIFLGFLGVHNFYLGFKERGMAQLILSLAGWLMIVGPIIAFVWGVIEGISILNGRFDRDSEGYLLK